MKKIAILPLSSKEKIIIYAHNNPLSMIHCCDDVYIVLASKKNKLFIGDINAIQFLNDLKSNCNKAICNDLFLDASLENKVGFIENEYSDLLRNERSKITRQFKEKPIEQTTYWVGYDYTLCGYRFRQTWLYNDNYENIVLEITPSYYFLPKRKKKKYNFYFWMEKKYKPILKRIISKEIAEKWVIQADLLIKIVEQNIAKMKNEHTMAVDVAKPEKME